jgi:hypothetical protein
MTRISIIGAGAVGVLTLALLCACGTSGNSGTGTSATSDTCAGITNAPAPHGNPAGYRVHSLTADSLTATQVKLNGLSLDTSSVSAISTSALAIVNATDAPTTVEDTAVGAFTSHSPVVQRRNETLALLRPPETAGQPQVQPLPLWPQ